MDDTKSNIEKFCSNPNSLIQVVNHTIENYSKGLNPKALQNAIYTFFRKQDQLMSDLNQFFISISKKSQLDAFTLIKDRVQNNYSDFEKQLVKNLFAAIKITPEAKKQISQEHAVCELNYILFLLKSSQIEPSQNNNNPKFRS